MHLRDLSLMRLQIDLRIHYVLRVQKSDHKLRKIGKRKNKKRCQILLLLFIKYQFEKNKKHESLCGVLYTLLSFTR